jgi:2-oxoglutarate dehydrogenase E1 component
MVEAPIFHVNGDDPEAVRCRDAASPLDYREALRQGRRGRPRLLPPARPQRGRTSPSVTQPLMYKKIAQHPAPRKLYARRSWSRRA